MYSYEIAQRVDEFSTGFQKVDLQQLNRARLLKRCDSKFPIAAEHLPDILQRLTESYYVLSIAERSVFRYASLYFDTQDFSLYHRHHNGRRNRHKLRYRHYLDTDECYFEIKTKLNTGLTSKTRLPAVEICSRIDAAASVLVNTLLHRPASDFEAALQVRYSRISLVRADFNERLTFDMHIEFGHAGERSALPGLVIAEVKQEQFSMNSPAMRVMKDMCIRPMSFSKYCIGLLQIVPSLKYNRFKKTLLTIGKLNNERK